LGLDAQAVVGQVNIGGEGTAGLFVSNLMGDVGEIGLGGADALGGGDGLLDAEVDGVLAVLEAVEDEDVEILQKGVGAIGDETDVGAVGEAADAEAEDGRIAV
jgi:hypothetical protein